MEIELMKFPQLNEENIKEVESAYCALLNSYRDHVPLKSEAIDWMDSANNWLMTSKD